VAADARIITRVKTRLGTREKSDSLRLSAIIDKRKEMLVGDNKSSPINFGRAAPNIPVSDITKSVDFYVTKLGMRKTFENGNPVGFVILRRDDAEIHLSLDKQNTGALRNVAHVIVSNARALYEELEAAGVRIVKGLRDQEYGLRDFVISDIDGNRIDVGERRNS
jgi:catechol 2,3-dioxygenase-like lactoylglutathione lyase family enzyme